MISGLANSWFENQSEKQKKVEVGIAGFMSMAIVDESFNLKSSAPIYYLEDGSYAQNHIILMPDSIRITGEVGDVWISGDSFKKAQSSITSNIAKVTSYLPDQAQALQQKAAALVNTVTDKLREIDRYMADGAQALEFLGLKADPSPKDIQEEFLSSMRQLRDTKQLFSVDMPYVQYENMYIENISISRNNQSKALKFDITASKIRIAEKVYSGTSTYKKNPSIEAAKQTGDKKAKTATPAQSLLSRGVTGVKGLFGF